MTKPDLDKCPYCGAAFVRQTRSGTIIWKCGTWRHDGKNVGDRSQQCHINQLEAKVASLEAVVRWAFARRDGVLRLTSDLSGPGKEPWMWSVTGKMPDEVRQTILGVLRAAEEKGEDDAKKQSKVPT